MQSLIYRSGVLYKLLMVLLYREHYASRYRSIEKLIPRGASVLDVCCGPAVLYDRYLKPKGVRYTGLDINDDFVAEARGKGITMVRADVNAISELPRADVVVMQASLYQFLPDRVPSTVAKMLKAAKKKLIVAEPVRNLSTSRIGCLARLAQQQTDAGFGACISRFDVSSLAEAMSPFSSRIEKSFLIPGGREAVYVLRPRTMAQVLPQFQQSSLAASC